MNAGATEEKGSKLLPPLLAVKITWALTGYFLVRRGATGEKSDGAQLTPKHETSRRAAVMASGMLNCVRKKAQGSTKEEQQYVSYALSTIASYLRSLDTAYKARELNFEENEVIRSSFLNSIKSSIDIGGNLKDHLLKVLPSIAIGGIGGFTVGQVVSNSSDVQATPFAILGILVGYIVGWIAVWLGVKATARRYVLHDYQRNLYFIHYTKQVSAILAHLYDDLKGEHDRLFKASAPVRKEFSMLIGLGQPGLCKHVHKHIAEGKVTSDLWPLCEASDESVVAEVCPHWVKGE